MSYKESDSKPSLSAQQKRFSAEHESPWSIYKDFAIGEGSWLQLGAYEIYGLLGAGLSGAAGLALRRFWLPHLLGSCKGKLTVGREVSIRQPMRVHCGRNVILEDFTVLDIRSGQNATPRIDLGDHVFVGRGTILAAKGGQLILSAGVNISSYCRIATQSKVEIGESTLIAAYCYIGPGNHKIEGSDVPIIEQGMDSGGGVRIGSDCWLGTRATILDGVTIGDHAVVGAHSLVTQDVPEGAIVGGTPARILRYRDD